MSINVEGATIRDLEKLLDIERKCFSEEAFSREQLEMLLIDYNSVGLSARINGEIVGFIIGRLDFVRNQLVGHVMTIDVTPTSQRMGVGQQLMIELEALFKQRDAKESHLEVRADNYAALILYTKLGYQKIALLENYYKSANGFYLRKLLI